MGNAVPRRRWVCPWCSTAYDIPASADDPSACPKCEAKRSPPEVLDNGGQAILPELAETLRASIPSVKHAPPASSAEKLAGCLIMLSIVGLPIWAIWHFWPASNTAPVIHGPPPEPPHVSAVRIEAPVAIAPPIATEPAFVPGLAASDIYLRLESQGFKRQGTHTTDDPLYGVMNWWEFVREQDGVRWSITMYGKGTKVAGIQASSVCRDHARGWRSRTMVARVHCIGPLYGFNAILREGMGCG